MSAVDWEDDEREWTVEGFIADCDHICQNPPPAPPGLDLIECEAEPRHWPTYVAHVEGMYPAPCDWCQHEAGAPGRRELEHKANHRRWHTWKITARFARWAYAAGVIAGSSRSFGGCDHCGTRVTLRWRGKRPYILWVERETWSCLLKYRHRRTTSWQSAGLCTKCLPCPDCRSTDPTHYVCGGGA